MFELSPFRDDEAMTFWRKNEISNSSGLNPS
jgi:hypothetical protein